MNRTALVVGAGPAGLLAAFALDKMRYDIDIVDRDTSFHPERIFSLQYLHDPCGLEGSIRKLQLAYKLEGDVTALKLSKNEAQYRQTVAVLYNSKLNRELTDSNSTQFLWSTPIAVWSLRDAYDLLYRRYAGRMKPEQMTWDRILLATTHYEVVVSTVPMRLLFPNLTWPVRTGLIAIGWTPRKIPENTCVYNLEFNTPWYRATNLDGGQATEFRELNLASDKFWLREWMAPQLTSLYKVEKGAALPPTPDNLLLTGRWGSWNPSKLTHNAYWDTLMFVAQEEQAHA